MFRVVHVFSAGRQKKINTKIKIKIYRRVIVEVIKEFEGAGEFIRHKINELCSEHGISAEEERLYIVMLVMLRTQFSYVQSSGRI